MRSSGRRGQQRYVHEPELVRRAMHGNVHGELPEQRLRRHVPGLNRGNRVYARRLQVRWVLSMSSNLRQASLCQAVALCSALGLSLYAASAHAQSTIKEPGWRPHYAVELEPHLVVTPFDPPDY